MTEYVALSLCVSPLKVRELVVAPETLAPSLKFT